MTEDNLLVQLACNPARANSDDLVSASLKQNPEDFVVDEIPLVLPDGQGEHAWLHIRKRNTNTDWLAGQIARFAGVERRMVSYAGRKDRNALTSQWFSVHLPGKEGPDWGGLNNDEIEVLQASRHSRKLKTGTLKGNTFTLRLQNLQGDTNALQQQLEIIQSRGVPNYFGEQRFGNSAENLESAKHFLFERKKVKRNQKSILLSASRSLLFNAVLDARVRADSWLDPVIGDVIQKDGRRGSFVAEEIDDELRQRLSNGEVHIAGPLWGRGRNNVQADAAEIERSALEPFVDWCDALEHKGLEMDRRAMRANVTDMEWSIEGDVLEIRFSLVAGSYATSVLRECVDWHSTR